MFAERKFWDFISGINGIRNFIDKYMHYTEDLINARVNKLVDKSIKYTILWMFKADSACVDPFRFPTYFLSLIN